MIVVYNSDERFASIFATSVVSLFECNKEIEELVVYLIEDHITDASKARFAEIAENYGRKIITIPMPDFEKLAGLDITIPQYNRMATCGRLFMASLLPADIDKVIYADCDTIFLKSLKELWDIDISEYFAAMTNDACNPAYRTMLDIPADGIYFNSGIMLVNLKHWREAEIEKTFVNYMISQGGYVPFPDQGVLNATLDGNIMLLPLKFNVISVIYAFSYAELLKIRKPKYFYSEQEVKEAHDDPVTVHFTNCFYISTRPWVKDSKHPYAQKYIEYRNKTPWRAEPLWEDKRPLINRIYSGYSHMAPKPLVVWTSMLIYLYVNPFMHRRKKRKSIKANKK